MTDNLVLQQRASILARRLYLTGAQPKERLTVLSLNQIDEHRRVYCRYYDLCLEAAEWSRWVSFTCLECPVEEEIPREQKRAEASDIYRALRNGRMLG